MPSHYIVKRGDTLSRIAREKLGTASLAKTLADFNGINDVNLIRVGQVIEVPSARDLSATRPTVASSTTGLAAAAAPAPAIPQPAGYDQIVATFGDVRANLDADGNIRHEWIEANIGRARLPFELPLSWNLAQRISSFSCHIKLVSLFEDVFQSIQESGLSSQVHSYGGCFNVRQKRTSAKLSTHSWGIAIDLNTETNALGTKGDMDERIVTIFDAHNFKWGGTFTGKKDPMHFQYCSGY